MRTEQWLEGHKIGKAEGRAELQAAIEAELERIDIGIEGRDAGLPVSSDLVVVLRERIRALLADDGAAALRERDAQVWDEGCAHTNDPECVTPCPQNPYRDTAGQGRSDDARCQDVFRRHRCNGDVGHEGDHWDAEGKYQWPRDTDSSRAADLPDGTVVAQDDVAWLRHPFGSEYYPWQGTNAGVANDRNVDEALAAGARVLRYGYDGGDFDARPSGSGEGGGDG